MLPSPQICSEDVQDLLEKYMRYLPPYFATKTVEQTDDSKWEIRSIRRFSFNKDPYVAWYVRYDPFKSELYLNSASGYTTITVTKDALFKACRTMTGTGSDSASE
mgnify:CR=1 FL=1